MTKQTTIRARVRAAGARPRRWEPRRGGWRPVVAWSALGLLALGACLLWYWIATTSELVLT